MNERLPSLSLPTPVQLAYSSGTASPRVSSVASSTSSNADSQSSYTSVASSNGPKTPPSSLPSSGLASGQVVPGPLQTPLVQPNISGYDHYHTMNQGAADMYYQQPHMPSGQAPPPQPVTSGSLGQYNPHQQPPLLQPGPAQYPTPGPYAQYGYSNGLTSPPTNGPVSNPMGGNSHVLPLPGVAGQSVQNYNGFDTSGQIAPPGMKPRVTATLWEDEGSLCFQVEARGVCVARREDNHMINGTKLLNVAGMTRGRRDGILKSEKVRHVVKIGPMHLKGVWIPFDRALDFANKEKITELLFPLFVHNIAALLYHPTNQTRTNQVMAAAERRKQEQNQMRNGQPPASGLPALQHHSSMTLPGPQQTLPSHNMATPGRPPLDRAHTFPTPPTSASSVIGGSMSAAEPFQWAQQGVNGAQATTPPGPPLQTMQPYPTSTQAYDNSRAMYAQSGVVTPQQQPPHHHHQPQQQQQQHTPQQQQTPQQPQPYGASAPTSSPHNRSLYGQAAATNAAPGYVKHEMPAAPTSRGSDALDQKPPNGLLHHPEQQQTGHAVHDDEHDHEAEYTHDSGAYDTSRAAPYNYGAQVAPMASDHHLSPEMTAPTAHHPNNSGRSTPRSAAAPQAYYAPQGYNTPPRSSAATAATQASSNLYNVMTNDRGASNGAQAADVYAPAADMAGSMQNGYVTSVMNGGGASAGMKRGRGDDDDRSPTGSAGGVGMDLKRRKTLLDSSMPSSVYDASAMSRAAPAIATQQRH